MLRHTALGVMAVMVCVCVPRVSWSVSLCSIDADTLAFGVYRPLESQHVDSLTRIQVTCEGEVGDEVIYRIRLNEGNGGSFQPRAMVQGPNKLQFNVFKNSARSQVWGDGSAGTEVISDTVTLQGEGELVTREHVAFARLFARQSVPIGSYGDVIQITLETCDTPDQCQVVMTVPLKIG